MRKAAGTLGVTDHEGFELLSRGAGGQSVREPSLVDLDAWQSLRGDSSTWTKTVVEAGLIDIEAVLGCISDKKSV